jgi:hypothetical protein
MVHSRNQAGNCRVHIIAQVEQCHNDCFLTFCDTSIPIPMKPCRWESIPQNGNGVVGTNGNPKPAWNQFDVNAAIEKTKQAVHEKGKFRHAQVARNHHCDTHSAATAANGWYGEQ